LGIGARRRWGQRVTDGFAHGRLGGSTTAEHFEEHSDVVPWPDRTKRAWYANPIVFLETERDL
jgi:hypothetical protein